jgi:hypothetical protein
VVVEYDTVLAVVVSLMVVGTEVVEVTVEYFVVVTG